MSLRWRATGEVLCGAKSEPHEDDSYIDDRLHYTLSAELRVLLPASDEAETGRWFWTHEVIRSSDEERDP